MNEPMNTEITSDDKLWALLAYVFSPLVSIILLVMEDKKSRRFVYYHSVQALALGVVDVLLSIFIGWTVVGLCIPLFLWFAMVYWGFQAYQGEYVTIPFLTDFLKNQGWL